MRFRSKETARQAVWDLRPRVGAPAWNDGGGRDAASARRVPRVRPGADSEIAARRGCLIVPRKQWARAVPLRALRSVDLIVVGWVAVTRNGHCCGKGEGYADLEFAILRELGHRPVKVVTTVHALQIVESFPADRHDLPVSAIVTPEELIRVRKPPRAPSRIDWDALTEDDLEAMPILKEVGRS